MKDGAVVENDSYDNLSVVSGGIFYNMLLKQGLASNEV
jgi:hypothetical protein